MADCACVGTEGAPGPPIAVVPIPLPAGGHALAYGEDRTVEMWDSPGFGAGPNAIMYPGSLVDFRYEYNFRSDLVVWTNVTLAIGATGTTACRLYATVQTNRWTVRYRITFDPPGSATAGRSHVATALTITITKDARPTRLATPVEGSSLEVRFPISLLRRAMDATS